MHSGGSKLLSVCFDQKFHNCYFSVMPKYNQMKIIT